MSSITFAGRPAMISSIRSAERRNDSGDHLSKVSDHFRTAASPLMRMSSRIPATRSPTSARSWRAASAEIGFFNAVGMSTPGWWCRLGWWREASRGARRPQRRGRSQVHRCPAPGKVLEARTRDRFGNGVVEARRAQGIGLPRDDARWTAHCSQRGNGVHAAARERLGARRGAPWQGTARHGVAGLSRGEHCRQDGVAHQICELAPRGAVRHRPPCLILADAGRAGIGRDGAKPGDPLRVAHNTSNPTIAPRLRPASTKRPSTLASACSAIPPILEALTSASMTGASMPGLHTGPQIRAAEHAWHEYHWQHGAHLSGRPVVGAAWGLEFGLHRRKWASRSVRFCRAPERS